MKSTSQSGLWTAEFGELGATLKALQDHGVTLNHLARLRKDADYAKRVGNFIARGGLEGSIHQKFARSLMGEKNFFGVEEWSGFYEMRFSEKQLQKIAEFPWGEDILNSPCPFTSGKTVKETHFAFLGLDRINGEPLNIRQWNKLRATYNQPLVNHSGSLYSDNQTCGFRWYLMPLAPATELLPTVPTDYEITLIIEETAKYLLYHRKNGRFPYQVYKVRCCQSRTFDDEITFLLGTAVEDRTEKDELILGIWWPGGSTHCAASRLPNK